MLKNDAITPAIMATTNSITIILEISTFVFGFITIPSFYKIYRHFTQREIIYFIFPLCKIILSIVLDASLLVIASISLLISIL